ncbi:18388_t:CDS:2 [Funneliformis geosporum]|uniref:18388_t:CDS:1 n=1 Tax=Funneliformis geosporum TaxID=1117311 RepID=A0A9W4WUM5_9GLOM|nr:18388_t:CDS:2 [Funneliformis geosporum]
MLKILRFRVSYRFLHTITIFASTLHSLHGLPATDVFSISNENKKYGTGSLFDLPSAPIGDNDNIEFGWKLGVIVTLVLLGGIFAGLTIGLMGLDETNLQVLMVAGESNERRHAKKVLDLLQKGKHWVLVTLLLSNVIVNETLPIIFDSVFGGGWPAVLISTALIVMFGEFVLFLMYVLFPVAYPIAGILDFCLGEQHGTMYRKSELKTFVSLHKNGGIESLNEDEVQIIGAVLDLREKPVSAIMTPLEDAFTLSADKVLDEQTVDEILSRGYSRIPVYEPPNPTNFIGMLLVKKLITYDPEDAWSVRDFSLSSLPETNPFTSCLDILKFFQEGRSHMALVSEDPGGNEGGALGVVTLEDVIEELIGEEIIDETDVYVDNDEIDESAESTKPLIKTNYHSTDGDHELVGLTNGIKTHQKEP